MTDRWKILILGTAFVCACATITFMAQAQNIVELSSPKVQQAITHIRLGTIEIARGKIGVTAMAGFRDSNKVFIGIKTISMSWSKQQVANNLTTEEVAALTSIRKKAKDAIIAKFVAQP